MIGRGTEINTTSRNEIEERRAVLDRAIRRGLSTCGEDEGEQGESKRDDELHVGLSFE